MKKLLLIAASVLILSACSFEVREVDPDEEKETFTIDIDKGEDEKDDKQ